MNYTEITNTSQSVSNAASPSRRAALRKMWGKRSVRIAACALSVMLVGLGCAYASGARMHYGLNGSKMVMMSGGMPAHMMNGVGMVNGGGVPHMGMGMGMGMGVRPEMNMGVMSHANVMPNAFYRTADTLVANRPQEAPVHRMNALPNYPQNAHLRPNAVSYMPVSAHNVMSNGVMPNGIRTVGSPNQVGMM